MTETKRCPKCNTSKEHAEFAKAANRADGLQSLCKACKRALDKDLYSKHPEAYYKRNLKARLALTEFIRAAKSRPCADCKQSFPFPVMEFDHLPGVDKKFNISKAVTGGSKSLLLIEIDKCEVVCANCHRMRTWNRRFGTDL